ncbi:MAG TPA: GNAT family N-acetyltransferase [Candidatus Saccharimonadales bacterium]|nr:GNAT family N-acetyltransferase [Candidatus Saccharimonadales bacterium]
MIEIPKNEKEQRLAEFDMAIVEPLLEESQGAFLPSKKNPDETLYDTLSYFRSDPEFHILGLQENNVPASYIMAISDKKRPNSLAIGPMYVGEEHRGRGLGKKQVEAFIEYAKAKKCTTVFTKTWGNNEASQAIFNALGFEVESIKEDDRADGDSTVNYLLQL